MNPNMRLTRELVDLIVFGMENQDEEFALDTEAAVVVPAHEADLSDDRFLELPGWRSVDGYNLMEQFVASLHNPIYRERLRAILSSGRGVFRQFKDTVRERREIERLWFSFKERRMREIVTDWFNDIRERQGLERLEATIFETETDQLLEVDFSIRPARGEDRERIAELDGAAFVELFPSTDPHTVAIYREQARAGAGPLDSPQTRALVTETQGGDFAGFLWATVRSSGEARVAFIHQIYTLPEYRGFGLARGLFESFCGDAHRERVTEVHLSLFGSALDLEVNFAGYGLERSSTTLRLDVERWHRSEIG